MTSLRSVLVLALLTSCVLPACSSEESDTAGDSSVPHISLGETQSGDGTYYSADGTGACSFDASPADLNVAALNAKDWAGSAYCGGCADVTGPLGSVRVRIVDLCPECASGDLDLSPQAFEKIAPLDKGRVGISWQLVACEVTGPMRYRYKDGSNQWWTAVQVINQRLPVQKAEWSKDGKSFQPLARTTYGYFLANSGFGPDPVTLRLTSMTGEVVTDALPAVQESLVVQGTAQFQ